MEAMKLGIIRVHKRMFTMHYQGHNLRPTTLKDLMLPKFSKLVFLICIQDLQYGHWDCKVEWDEY